jgi:hypothetical protein
MPKTIGQIPSPYKKILTALVRADSRAIEMVFALIRGAAGTSGKIARFPTEKPRQWH